MCSVWYLWENSKQSQHRCKCLELDDFSLHRTLVQYHSYTDIYNMPSCACLLRARSACNAWWGAGIGICTQCTPDAVRSSWLSWPIQHNVNNMFIPDEYMAKYQLVSVEKMSFSPHVSFRIGITKTSLTMKQWVCIIKTIEQWIKENYETMVSVKKCRFLHTFPFG